MSKIFYRKQFSDYLGENRAILDIVNGYVADPTPSPSPTPTITPTVTITPTITPTATYTPTPTPSATPGFDFCIGTGFDDYTNSVMDDSNNKMVIGGLFQYYKNTFSPGVIRLDKTTGSYDSSFVSPFSAGVQINVIKPSSYFSGKYYVGGVYGQLVFEPSFQRLNSDGSIDTSFSGLTGMTGQVYDFKELSDGTIIVSGTFTTVNGLSRPRLVKLNTDGSVNTTFQVGTGPNSLIYKLELSSDESTVYLGGIQTTYSGLTSTRLTKINTTTGVMDTSFQTNLGSKINNQVRELAFDSNDNLWIVGQFNGFPTTTGSTQYIAIVTTSGTTVPLTTIDIGGGFEDATYGIIYDSVNDRMIVTTTSVPASQNSNTYRGQTFYGRIMAINCSDGSLDSTFGSTSDVNYGFSADYPGQNNTANEIFIDNNDDIYVIGAFTRFSGNRIDRLIKLTTNGQSITRTNC